MLKTNGPETFSFNRPTMPMKKNHTKWFTKILAKNNNLLFKMMLDHPKGAKKYLLFSSVFFSQFHSLLFVFLLFSCSNFDFSGYKILISLSLSLSLSPSLSLFWYLNCLNHFFPFTFPPSHLFNLWVFHCWSCQNNLFHMRESIEGMDNFTCSRSTEKKSNFTIQRLIHLYLRKVD